MRTHPFLAVPVRGARRIASLAAAAAALLFVSGVAAAQQGGAIPLSTPIDVNTGVPMQATSKASGFNLFASEDLAGTTYGPPAASPAIFWILATALTPGSPSAPGVADCTPPALPATFDSTTQVPLNPGTSNPAHNIAFTGCTSGL